MTAIKDTARKITNSVVDTTENIIGKPKSVKELAKRLVEHVSHKEYEKVADIMIDELKKHANTLGFSNLGSILESSRGYSEGIIKDVSESLAKGDDTAVFNKLDEVDQSISNWEKGLSTFSKATRNFLKELLKDLKSSSTSSTKSTGDKEDFSKIEETLAKHLTQLMNI